MLLYYAFYGKKSTLQNFLVFDEKVKNMHNDYIQNKEGNDERK